MPLIATNYDGFWILLQTPFSFVAAFLAARFAFKNEKRVRSMGFASLAILFSLVGVWREDRNEDVLNVYINHPSAVILTLFPLVVGGLVFVFGIFDRRQK